MENLTLANPNIVFYDKKYYICKNYDYNSYIYFNILSFNDGAELLNIIKIIYNNINNNIYAFENIPEIYIYNKDYFIDNNFYTKYCKNQELTNFFPTFLLENNKINSVYLNEKTIYANDIESIYLYNKYLENKFTINQLENLTNTFLEIIKTNNELTETPEILKLYNIVLNFDFVLGDITYNNLLNIDSQLNTNINTSSNCSCSTYTSNIISTTDTCSSIYLNSINNILVQMLGDIIFYKAYFYNKDKKPNINLIDTLETLLHEFLENCEYMLDKNYKNTTVDATECINVSLDYINCNKNIILLYIEKVLENIKNNIDINNISNTIKVYGENFGNLIKYLHK